jgi:quercetin dioxygenase-like cupin family protein
LTDEIHITPFGEGANVAGLLVKVFSADTGGAYCVMELTLPPGGGAPQHVHYHEDEIITVMEGTLSVTSADGRDHKAAVGSVVRLPKGARHAFRNATDAPVRVLITAIPGGLDNYFAALGALDKDATQDDVTAINRQFEIDFSS